jgi:hypothetical protein
MTLRYIVTRISQASDWVPTKDDKVRRRDSHIVGAARFLKSCLFLGGLAFALADCAGGSQSAGKDDAASGGGSGAGAAKGSYFMCDSISEEDLTTDGVTTMILNHTCVEHSTNYQLDWTGFIADCASENTSGKGLGGSTTLHCVEPDLGSKCVVASGTSQYADDLTIYTYCDTGACAEATTSVEAGLCHGAFTAYGSSDAGAAGSGG